MEYTVKQLATLAGVSPRTLRWYDAKGLLPPTRVTQAGYRIYDGRAVDRLQQILFFRELGVPLPDIQRILDSPGFSEEAALESHLCALTARRAQIDAMILTVQKTLADRKGEHNMTDHEKFLAFKQGLVRENESKYGQESRTAYGDSAVDDANANMLKMSQAQYNAWKELEEAILAALAEAVQAGCAPDGPQGQKIAELHRQWLGGTIQKYDPRQHAGIAELYVADERFAAYYDKAAAGAAQFLRDAVACYTSKL